MSAKTVRGRRTIHAAVQHLESRRLMAATPPTGSLTGFVFNDITENGATSDDRPMPGVTVYADLNANGQVDPGEPSAVSANNGSYTLTDVPVGTITISEVLAANQIETGAGASQTVTVSITNTASPSFLNFTEGRITGSVSLPAGSSTAGFSVYIDKNLDGVYDTGDVVTSVDTSGFFSFGNLAAGTDAVGVIAPPTWVNDSGFQTETIQSGVNDVLTFTQSRHLEFTGTVQTTGGAALSGVTVKAVSGTTTYTTTTSAAGGFDFYNVSAGTYTVTTTAPSGYTAPAPQPVTVPVGNTIPSLAFSLTPTSTGVVVQLTGTPIGTAGSYQNNGDTFAKAFDGNLTTYVDGASANGNWAGLDLGTPQVVTEVKFASRSGWASRLNGGIFQAGNSATFASGVVNLYTIPANANPSSTVLTTASFTNTTAYRYYRYLSPNGSYGNVAELQFLGVGTVTPPPTLTHLTGATIGTAGSFQNDGSTIAKATDGSLSTFFDGPTANGNWVGVDLGSTGGVVKQAQFASRSGWASRMNGGIFQASDSATFASGVVNLYTIPSGTNPSSTSLTTVTISNTTAYRYYRYLSPNGSYGDISEVQFFGTSGGLATLTQRTGTTIGTAGSYSNSGNTIAKATDGNLGTYFDGPTANGNWVGLDLGTAQSISQISFAPRSGYTSRMVGGIFQVSSTADFSSGVSSVYTITIAPTAGVLTTVTLSTPVSARYVRYLSPSGSYGDIAEMAFYG